MKAKLVNENVNTKDFEVEVPKLNIAMVRRELNVLEEYTTHVKRHPESNDIISFADTVFEFIEEIKDYLNI